jgi:transcriptional regulator with XRE-family HTH domain
MTNCLRTARLGRGLSQAQVISELRRRAAASGVSIASEASLKVMVSGFENGRRAVCEPYRSLFRAIYGMTDEELFGSGEEAYEDARSEYDMLAERIASARTVDHSTALMLSRQTDYLRTMDCRLGAAPLVDQMTGHLATVEQALSHAILPSVRQPLAAVLADAAALAAWQALDVGAVNRAWKYHETARYAALEARDSVLLTHAMAQQAFVLVDIGEEPAALELVREARREAGSRLPAKFLTWLRAAEGEVAAANGDDQGCRLAFDEAMQLLPSREPATDPDMPYIVLNEAHLARWRGHSFARLGDCCSVDDLQTALASGGVGSTRAEAGLRCDLACALLLLNERDEARKHAAEARRLARRAGSVRQRQRLDKLSLIVA